MDRWRKYFSTSGIDIWTVCERALTLAYQEEDADEFAAHRDQLAQKLFAPEKLDQQEMESNPPKVVLTSGADHQRRRDLEVQKDGDLAGVDSGHHDQWQPNRHYDQAQALTEEMEEESLLKKGVFELKEIILDSYKSENEVFHSLQKLVLMQLSFDVLKETEIGKTVNSVRKHSSSRIRTLAKQLVSDWKDTADHWYKSVKDVTRASVTAQSESPSERDGHGLPSPPMDEGALLAGRSTSIEMSQLFEFMADETSAGDTNFNSQRTIQKSGLGLVSNQQEDSKTTFTCRKTDTEVRKNQGDMVHSDMRKKETGVFVTDGHAKREHTAMNEYNDKREMEEANALQSETSEKNFSLRGNNQNPKEHDEKLLAARRKLQETYQQAENAKRQRTIQVMELEDLPKGGPKRSRPVQMTCSGKTSSQSRYLQTFRR